MSDKITVCTIKHLMRQQDITILCARDFALSQVNSQQMQAGVRFSNDEYSRIMCEQMELYLSNPDCPLNLEHEKMKYMLFVAQQMVARVLEQVSEQAGAPDQARKFAPSNLMLVLDDVWRTFKPHGPDSDDYQRVLLDKPGPDGKILSGLGGKYNGKTISELVRSQEEPDEDTDEYGDEDEYVAPTTAPSSYELAPSEMMVNQAEPSSSSALAQLVARVNQTAPDIVNTSVSAYLPAEPTPIWPLKFPDIDEVMVEACVLPDKSIIDDLDEDELNYFKDLYRSQRQILEAKCTRNELRALFLGPAKFAKSDLKDTPHLEINSPEAQEAYNRLEAEMLAARAIRKLRSAGILHTPADKLQQIKQLEMQLKQARQSYCEYSQPVTADILRENFEAAHQGLAYPEEQHFQEQCDQALTQALKQQYQSGKLLSFPWICRVFMQPDFTCSNAYIETWLDAAKLQALLTNGISGKAICQRLASKKYKALLETTEQQLKQAQQMLELHEGCSLRKALDREFSRYCHQQIPLLRQHDIKPEALCNTLAGPNMSFKQADHKRPNPHYDTQIPGVKPSKSPYRHNCPLCAVAYEVRRRGFNIEAGPYFEDLDAIKLANSIKELDPMALLSLYSQLIWHNPNTEASPDVTYFAELSPRLNHANMAQIAEVKLNKLLQPNQRFHLAFQWAAGGGHIVTVEKSAHGQLIIYDPQSGQNYSVAEYFSPQHNPKAKSIRLTSLRTYRVDNCEISTDFANYILTQAGTPAVKTAYNLTNDWSITMVEYDGQEFDDDIPENVARQSDGMDVEYCGIYKGWDAYRLGGRLPPNPLFEGLTALKGYPQYLLVARDGSGKCEYISDEELYITYALHKQLKQLRRYGHKKRS